MKELWIVTKETYLRQVKSWTFFFMIISPFIFLAISTGISYISGNSAEKANQIAVVVPAKDYKTALINLDNVTYKYNTKKAAKKALDKEKVTGYLLIENKDNHIVGTYKGKDSLSMQTKGMINQSLYQLQTQLSMMTANLSPDQIKAINQKPELKVVSEKKNETATAAKFISFYGLIFIMYMIIIIYAAQTAQEIASEKGTKIMEVVFSSVPAEKYFYGRILGIFGVILTHVLIYIVGGYLTYEILSKLDGTKDMVTSVKPLLKQVFKHFDITILGFAVLGLLIFVVLAALCGSLVARAEQANQAAQPAIYLVMVGFLGSFALGQAGSDLLALKIGSYIPFLSTFFMPVRLINGYASQMESFLSLAILALAAFLLIVFIGKSYSGLILQTDDIGFFKSLKKGLAHK
ncbi:ABC transporter permease [Streptococcus parauberis]|uniref:ABC transporter permease n=1 Tax=Streptococcus parauberis TaxID=1348 RepID=UPI000E30126D|nr:ABC transporter permease [Streptococcus parauberis]RFE02634.1 ABC-2 family transporter protein [Streptococcus parauberis]